MKIRSKVIFCVISLSIIFLMKYILQPFQGLNCLVHAKTNCLNQPHAINAASYAAFGGGDF
jgi:hypothetical protein